MTYGGEQVLLRTDATVLVEFIAKENENNVVQVRPVVLCACRAWVTTKSDERKLEIFERNLRSEDQRGNCEEH